MFKKPPAAPATESRLSKVRAKKAAAAKQARAQFTIKVYATKADAVTTARADRLVDKTRAAKSAAFVDQYRRTAA